MKKVLSLFLILTLLWVLAGCSGSASQPDPSLAPETTSPLPSETIPANQPKLQLPGDTVFYSPLEEPFSLLGLIYEEGAYGRMPQAAAQAVSPEVGLLSTQTAGGRVSFRTDSPWLVLDVKLKNPTKMPQFPLSGSAGFDLYQTLGEDQVFLHSFLPPWNVTEGYQQVLRLDGSMQEYTLYFPLASGVTELSIGLKQGAQLAPSQFYRDIPPIVTYGSSITQGLCASRPGNTYQSMLSRRFRVDHVNLGFSGAALGEQEIMDYIAGLPMSLFILDYDFNAPDADHLLATHRKAYETVRKAQPDLPILLLSKPHYYLNSENRQRMDIILDTYQNARNAGDQNVYFLSGPELMAYCRTDGTGDGVHPNDYGFASMAQVIGDLLQAYEIFPR